ncbi:hypothetical protein GQ602_006469 [Ophiocordyceps camponoti-floridani]|uniref:Uncharacterized protein n=1 Tax=Ophiocordyceps camponoti-floridani TaxID=2030778 RepID=A0A8H4Q184_9HYPO|nr:hypothetical protein GQ602_006469 [Ophiocordyceps camponoti-floridani]
MGMHGPLTAQALGRSPYDDVVEGEGEEDSRQPTQQYDCRGRPINPETRRMNREIVRAHNEVMLVIGVAETENTASTPEPESQRRHEDYEESIGNMLFTPSEQCIDAIGYFGLDGLRQRILTFTCYSRIPFSNILRSTRRNFSFKRDILAGAPTSIAIRYLQSLVKRGETALQDRPTVKRFFLNAWSYFRHHLELYAVLQRLGLAPDSLLLPNPMFFIPFTHHSPITAPPFSRVFSISSLLSWVEEAVVMSAPFIVWVMTQRLMRKWKFPIWGFVFRRLPNTMFRGRRCTALPPLSLPPPTAPSDRPRPTVSPDSSAESPGGGNRQAESRHQTGSSTTHDTDSHAREQSASSTTGRRPSILSARADEYASDEEENEGVSATLISFDVEATDSSDAPPGLWSAELRPSAGTDSKSTASLLPVYLDTALTQLPVMAAGRTLGDALVRILTAPTEAIALRLVAHQFHWRRIGYPFQSIYNINFSSHLPMTTFAVNFFATELLHLALCGEVWAIFTGISQWYHRTDEEWQEEEEAKARG